MTVAAPSRETAASAPTPQTPANASVSAPAPQAAPTSEAASDERASLVAGLREDLLQPDPLLDALVQICRLHGVAASRPSLSASLPLVNGKLTVELVERACARAGMASNIQRLPLPRIDVATLPLVLLLKNDEACVLVGTAVNGEAIVLMPSSGQGEVRLSVADLHARYTGIAISVRPRFRMDARAESTPGKQSTGPARAAGHWFWSTIWAQRSTYRDVLLAALLINVFALAFPMFSMNVYDRVVPNQAVETLWALAIGVSIMLTADLAMRLLRSRFVDEASARIDVQLSAALMEKVLGMRLEKRPASVGSLASNMRGFESIREFIASSTVTTLVDLPFALTFVLVIAWISPWLAVPVLVAGASMTVLAWVMQKRLHALARTTYQASAMRNATLVESLSGIETIKSQGAEGLVQGKWERANAFLSTTNIRMRALSARATSGSNLISQLTSVAVIIVGVYLMTDRQITMGALIAATTLASRALGPAGQVVGLLMQFQSVRTGLDGLNQLMAQPQERDPTQTYLQRPHLQGAIEFRNVSFSYPGREDKVLDNVSFKLNPGERVAFIGRVGSGKSTIQRLIMGLYQPTDGQVLLDGVDIRQLDPADVRRNQGYVSQDVTLFFGSLRENIAWAVPNADDSAIVAAAELAGLTDFVQRHPRGFDMPVGERGETLSGGQRQCVGLARAVLHQAPVLLLDEPTSAMDFSTEAQITKRIGAYAEGKTMVLVTHRTSMLELTNRLIVIDGGKVVADGPRARILEALAAGRIAKAN